VRLELRRRGNKVQAGSCDSQHARNSGQDRPGMLALNSSSTASRPGVQRDDQNGPVLWITLGSAIHCATGDV